MASSRKVFTVWQDENEENVIPENPQRIKRSASVSDTSSVYDSESTKSCVNTEKKITAARGVLKEKNNNVRARHHSLTSQIKKGVENVEFIKEGRLHGKDCKLDAESQRFKNEKRIMAKDKENENSGTSGSSASTSNCGVRMIFNKGKLKLNLKLTSSEWTGSDNWRKSYQPRILGVRQNEGTATPVEFSIPPFLEKVKEQRRRISKKVPVKGSTDESQPYPNTRSAVTKASYDPDEAEEYITMQFEREKRRGIVTILQNDFVSSPQRKILVDFLMRVNIYRGDSPFILYQTIKIMDAAVNAMKTNVQDLQVTALAAMWISIKRDNLDIPTATSMIAFGGDELKDKEKILQKFELRILKALNFDVSYPDVSSILAHFIFTLYGTSDDHPRIDVTYDCGNFFIDIAICDMRLGTESAILLAGVAAVIALFLVENPNECLLIYFENQFSRLPHPNKFLYAEAVFTREILIAGAFDWRSQYNKGARTFQKYAHKRYRKIKEFLLENIARLNLY